MDEDHKKSTKGRNPIVLGLLIAADFGAMIAIPVVVFVFIGKWLDKTYSQGPKFTIIAFILAALLSTLIIRKKSTYYAKEYEKIE